MKKVVKVILVLLVGAIVWANVAQAPAHPMPHPTKERYLAHKCERGDVKACIHRAALHWGADYGSGLYIAHRESRFDCGVTNSSSGAAGLFQFMPRTWAYTPYRSSTPYSCRDAALAWAWMWTHGWKSAWA